MALKEDRPIFRHKTVQIHDFVEWELDFFRKNCNFTEEELEYFNYRAKGFSNVNIAYKMSCSEPKISVLAKKVKNKMIRVI